MPVMTYVYWNTLDRMVFVRAPNIVAAGHLATAAVGGCGLKRRLARLDRIDAPTGIVDIDIAAMFAEQLNAAVRLSGKKAADIVKATGVYSSQMCRWMNGASTPRLDNALVVASGLGYSIDALLTPGELSRSSPHSHETFRWADSWNWLSSNTADLSAYVKPRTVQEWKRGVAPSLVDAHHVCARLGHPIQALAVGIPRRIKTSRYTKASLLHPDRALTFFTSLVESGVIWIDAEAGRVFRRRADRRVAELGACRNRHGDAVVNVVIRGRQHAVLLARLVYASVHGHVPPGHRIVHRNDDRTDNRILNLVALPATRNKHER